MPSPTCTVTLPLSQARAESDPTLARPWDRTGHQHRPLCPGGCPAPVALCWKLPIPPSPGPDEDMEAAGTRPLTTGPALEALLPLPRPSLGAMNFNTFHTLRGPR